jgi:hypothetical protein
MNAFVHNRKLAGKSWQSYETHLTMVGLNRVLGPFRLVLVQNKKDLLTNWWNEGKLEASEELGDLVSNAGDKDMALKIYQLCGASGKVRNETHGQHVVRQ